MVAYANHWFDDFIRSGPSDGCGITDSFTRTTTSGVVGYADCQTSWTVQSPVHNNYALVDGSRLYLVQGDVPVSIGGGLWTRTPTAVVTLPLTDFALSSFDAYFEFQWDLVPPDLTGLRVRLTGDEHIGTQYTTIWGNQIEIYSSDSANYTSVPITLGSGVYSVRIHSDTLVGQPTTVSLKLWATGSFEPAGWTATWDAGTGFSGALQYTPYNIFKFDGLTGSYGSSGAVPDRNGVHIDNLDITGVSRCSAVQFDSFSRVVPSASGFTGPEAGAGVSTPSHFVWNTQGSDSQRHISVDGTRLVFNWSAVSSLGALISMTPQPGVPWLNPSWVMTLRFTAFRPSGTSDAILKFDFASYARLTFTMGIDDSLSVLPSGDMSFGWTDGADYLVKWDVTWNGPERFKVWLESDPEPDWLFETASNGSGVPTSNTFDIELTGNLDHSSTARLYIDWIDFAYTGRPSYYENTNNWGAPPDFPPSGTFTYIPPGNGDAPIGTWVNSFNGEGGAFEPDNNHGSYAYVTSGKAHIANNDPIGYESNGITIATPLELPIEVLMSNMMIHVVSESSHVNHGWGWQCYLSYAYGVNSVGFYPWISFSMGTYSSSGIGHVQGDWYTDMNTSFMNPSFTLAHLFEHDPNGTSPDLFEQLFNVRLQYDDLGARFRWWLVTDVEPTYWHAEVPWDTPGISLDPVASGEPIQALVIENDVYTAIGQTRVAELIVDRVDVWYGLVPQITASTPPSTPVIDRDYGVIGTGWGSI